jgi:hypothetical protein
VRFTTTRGERLPVHGAAEKNFRVQYSVPNVQPDCGELLVRTAGAERARELRDLGRTSNYGASRFVDE